MARKILLADDSVTAQNMGRKILADAGYEVVTVNNGSAALKRIAEIKPDLIVLDVYMPGYSGLEVCQRLKDSDDTAHIPVLLTVGKLEPFKPEEARRVRADAHIVKPFEASELLTAITGLEDRMVPQPSDGSRFASGDRFGSEGVGRKTETKSDTGWKSRLRFPSKKKKEEPEPEIDDAALGATFRDFRRGKAKADTSRASAAKAPRAAKEPEIVPDIPRDITPEELDALSAVAAKLDGPAAVAETSAGPAEKPVPVEAAGDGAGETKGEPEKTEVAKIEIAPEVSAAPESKTETAPGLDAAAKTEPPAEVKTDAISEQKPIEENSTLVAATATIEEPVAAPAFAVEAPASAVEEIREIQIPVEPIEVAAEAAPAAAHDLACEIRVDEAAPRETPPTEANTEAPDALMTVDTALFNQEVAPVERNDEPLFALTASGPGPTVPEERAEANDEPAATAVAVPSESLAPTAPAEAPVVESPESAEAPVEQQQAAESQLPEPKPEEVKGTELPAVNPRVDELGAEEMKAETIEQSAPVAASLTEPAEPEEPAPTDEELAEALRLLTPTGHAEISTLPSHGTLVAAGQLLAEEAARAAAAAPRWIAEPVELSPEEAALSLEAEMFGTFAGSAPSVPAPAQESNIEVAQLASASQIAVAIENHPVALSLEAGEQEVPSKPVGELLPEPGSAEQADTISGATSAAEAPATTTAMPPDGMSLSDPGPAIDEPAMPELKSPGEPIAQDNISADTPMAVQKDAAADIVTEPEEASAATFADAIGREEVELQPATPEGPKGQATVSAAPDATAEENHDSRSDAGGEEIMGKDAKAKSGKSNWHQIRTASAGAAAASDVVEQAKQAEGSAEEAPKAMAAAAAAQSAPAPDASTIASIVDSVMADLRPKIVEEIAKKLAGK
ncbi:MAG: response regulator [Terriglobales bacterium]